VTTPPVPGQAAAAARLHAATSAKRQVVRQVEDEWRAAVRAAFATGMTGGEVAVLAGVTEARIYQVRDNRR
jgi:hypothetical protein